MDTRGKSPRIALATYTPLEYKNVESVRINFTTMGYECVGVAIQVDALERFCHERGQENNGAARAEYASFLLMQQEQRQTPRLENKARAPRKQ